jgi:uncharacterized membrane protein
MEQTKMTPEDMNQKGMGQPETGAGSGQPSDGPTPVERAAGMARDQATEAATALSRGEFIHEAVVDPAANNDDKLIALLSYITQSLIPVVMPVIVLLSESSKHRPFQRYHAVQSLALCIVFYALISAAAVGTAIIQIVPLIGQLVGLLMFCLLPIVWAMYVVAQLYYGYQAYQGKRFAIPGLTSFLRDQGWV